MLSFLLYHEIGEQPRNYANLDCFCLEERFREQMRFLKDSGIPVLSSAEISAQLNREGTLPADGVILTFDDADISFLEHAMPILEEVDFPSTVFAVAGRLGQCANWTRDSRNAIPLMNAGQLRSLPAHRIELGSHSMNHRKLTEITEVQVFAELRDSKAALEDILGRPVPSLAYPHGLYSRRVMEMSSAVGYLDAYCTDGVRVFADIRDRMCIPRKYITCHDTIETFAKKIAFGTSLQHSVMPPIE